MNLVFLGAPGAGKGTQAEKLTEDRGLAYISTGKILREAITGETPLGLEAKKFVEAGKLVPDEVVVGLVEEFLAAGNSDGFLLDGFPRNLPQAKALGISLERLGLKLDKIVYFSLDEDAAIERLSGRRTCSVCGKNWHVKFNPPPADAKCDEACDGEVIQREDDKPETIKKRLAVYKEQTAALVDYYAGLGILANVDASAGVDEVYKRLQSALGAESGIEK